jgi:hypothetical protein
LPAKARNAFQPMTIRLLFFSEREQLASL